MRRHLLGGGKTILGLETGTLIYGAGKQILRSFFDFSLCMEPYINCTGNQIYYFGGLDYERRRDSIPQWLVSESEEETMILSLIEVEGQMELEF